MLQTSEIINVQINQQAHILKAKQKLEFNQYITLSQQFKFNFLNNKNNHLQLQQQIIPLTQQIIRKVLIKELVQRIAYSDQIVSNFNFFKNIKHIFKIAKLIKILKIHINFQKQFSLSDISQAQYPNLQILNLNYCQFTSIQVIQVMYFPNLKELCLQSTKISQLISIRKINAANLQLLKLDKSLAKECMFLKQMYFFKCLIANININNDKTQGTALYFLKGLPQRNIIINKSEKQKEIFLKRFPKQKIMLQFK